jgi:hypothetical protein
MHLIGCAVLEAAVRALGSRDILLMPLKGIWLQVFVYADPGERPITDVDVLVREADYAPALAALRDAGWKHCDTNVFATALRAPGLPLVLDLHRRLFARSAFRMPSAELFERGTPDRERYGCEVVLPAALDVFAHLVGHFVKSRGGRDSPAFQRRDFVMLAEHCRLEPTRTAQHLVRCGLARASRYALRCVSDDLDTRGFCRATLAALPPDPSGDASAAALLRLRDRIGRGSRLAALPGFALEPSLSAALGSLALRTWDRGRELVTPG